MTIDTLAVWNRYSRMVRSAAWRSARRYDLDFKELEAQAIFVFFEALRRFDAERATFSTFLMHRLRTLEDFAEREAKRDHHTEIPLDWEYEGTEGMAEIPQSFGVFESLDDRVQQRDKDKFLDRMYPTAEKVFQRIERERQLTRLSEDAQEVLIYLCGHEWETPGVSIKTRPTFLGISQWYQQRWGWTPRRIREAWAELEQWWAEGARECYA
jgi:hypothetical protein